MNKPRALVGIAIAVSIAIPVMAQAGTPYVGGGISNNSISGWDSAVGFQVFGGYNFGEIFGVEKLDFLGEAGYMQTNDLERSNIWYRSRSYSGLWTTGGVAYPINPQWSVLGRAGFDFGDDDGLMVGGGAAFHVDRNLEFRGELVERDHITSFQINAVYGF
ncbi:porin family protein [Thiohalomonas denitrificans]|uniref:porin family protein n=1 Tax=Thiohalomonas denitrificans TaxID=415747 RepID=UPI0026F1F35E|nr:porin family protein [Thiohalomonas denitrificans]